MSEKFEKDDLPKILEALKEAKEAGSPSSVTISFSAQGGVISIRRKLEKEYKGKQS